VEAAISVVTLAEIYYKYYQEKRPDLAEARTTDIRHAIYLKKLEIGEEVTVNTEAFKSKYKVPIANALIAASAYLQGLTIISYDPGFKKYPESKS
jgi:predicted nucleic acid-binding protein